MFEKLLQLKYLPINYEPENGRKCLCLRFLFISFNDQTHGDDGNGIEYEGYERETMKE
jgi:hypothetical protein